MSDNKPVEERDGKEFLLKWLAERAKMLQSQMDSAKVEEIFATLTRYLSQMIDDWQLIALETKLKDFQNLNNAIQRSFDCGVIFGMLFQHFQHLDDIELLLKTLREDKDLRDKQKQLENMMPKQTEDLSYIR